ncbi:MAG: Hsp20/alpha crystallin family protein [Candidatus Helarchaeota archaeon]|nr:Hsp20/alpha crystallin family protein [Candidatus Helarchaeota archaeon]
MSDNYYDDDEDDEFFPKKKEKKKKDKIIWSRGPDWNEVFGPNFFKNVDMSDIEKIIKKLMEQINFPDDKHPSKGPVVWGFSMSYGPDKKPVIRPFGNIKPRRKRKMIQETREPLVDIIEEDTEIIVIAEIPGVIKSDINLNTTETMLTLSVDTPKRKYFKEILFPYEVDPNSVKAHYKNGILEIKLKKKRLDDEFTSIQVD